jgi:hypothetical protein
MQKRLLKNIIFISGLIFTHVTHNELIYNRMNSEYSGITFVSNEFTSFYLWAADNTQQPQALVNVDFTANNNKILSPLNTALSSGDVTLKFTITPTAQNSPYAYKVSVQGYNNQNQPITQINYKEPKVKY